MKTCCLVWEIPVIEGEHYNPIVNVIYMQKAKKFLNQLNRYFQDKNMDWKEGVKILVSMESKSF